MTKTLEDKRYQFTFDVKGMVYQSRAPSEAEAYAKAFAQLRDDLMHTGNYIVALSNITEIEDAT